MNGVSGVSGVSEMSGVRGYAGDEVEGLPRPSEMRLKGYLGPLGDYEMMIDDDDDDGDDDDDEDISKKVSFTDL